MPTTGERASCHEHDQSYWTDDGCPVCNVIAESDGLREAIRKWRDATLAMRDIGALPQGKFDALWTARRTAENELIAALDAPGKVKA